MAWIWFTLLCCACLVRYDERVRYTKLIGKIRPDKSGDLSYIVVYNEVAPFGSSRSLERCVQGAELGI